MHKIYKSHTFVSINVKVGGELKHITFNEMSGGASYYYTDKKEEIKGLEAHPRFGTLFVLDQEVKEEKTSAKTEEKAEKTEEAVMTEVEVQSLEDAKEYLADNFDIARSNLKSKAKIVEAAKEHNIVFKGI